MTKGEKIIHNVRGPLNSIAMNAELSKMYIKDGKTSERTISALDTIIEQCAACSVELDSLYRYLADLERS